jgi:hypothetical protein
MKHMRQRATGSRRRKRPNLLDRLELRLATTNMRIDGLWIGTAERESDRLLRRVEGALRVIKTHDRRLYDRLIHDVERVWIRVVPHGLGTFNEPLKTCELDTRFVLAETSSPEAIAATIVHEATHARLLRYGIGYKEEIRARVEAVCLRRELAFAAKLPNGEQVRRSAERTLELSGTPGFWTDKRYDERAVEGGVEALRHLGWPDWLVRTVLAIRALRLSISRRVRGSNT